MFENNNFSGEHLTIIVIGYVICFISLALLQQVFQALPRLLALRWKRRQEDTAPPAAAPEPAISGEETAAISAAIWLFVEELHDQENTVLTIRRISRKYSPWSSKIYNVINGLNKRF